MLKPTEENSNLCTYLFRIIQMNSASSSIKELNNRKWRSPVSTRSVSSEPLHPFPTVSSVLIHLIRFVFFQPIGSLVSSPPEPFHPSTHMTRWIRFHPSDCTSRFTRRPSFDSVAPIETHFDPFHAVATARPVAAESCPIQRKVNTRQAFDRA